MPTWRRGSEDAASTSPESLRTRVDQIRAHLREPLFRNAYALMLSQVGMGATGVLYWSLAARRYSVSTVGENAGLISAMMTLSTFAQLDLAAMLTKFLPAWRRMAARAIGVSYLVACLTAVVASITFVLAAPRISDKLAFLAHPDVGTMFCIAAVAWGVFSIQDGVLTGLGRAVVVPIENTGYGLGKLLLLLLVGPFFPRWGIFVSWIFPMIVLLAPINLLIFRRYLPLHRDRIDAASKPMTRRTVARYMGIDYLTGLCGISMTTAIPVVVLNIVGPNANGHFYIAWTFIMMLEAISLSLGTSVLVESSYNPARAAEYGRRALRRMIVIIVPCTALLILLAPIGLSVFGRRYSSTSTSALRILALGVLPMAVTILYVSMERARGRVGRMFGVVAVQTALVLGLVIGLGSRFGLNGVAAGWTLGNTVVGLAVVMPLLVMIGGRVDSLMSS